MYEYDLLIKQYHTLFLPENVLILLHEQLQENVKSFLRDLSLFLGVDSSFTQSNLNKVVNVARAGKSIATQRFLNYFRISELNSFPMIERKQNGRLLPLIVRLLFMLRSTDSILCDKIKEEIKQYYREPDRRLYGLIGKDLSNYF